MGSKHSIAVIILAVLVLVASLAAYLLTGRYDLEKHKPGIEQAVLSATGRKLSISGDLWLELGLRPKLYAENVSFANAAWGSSPEMASARKLCLTVALFPILSGRADVLGISLEEPAILLETGPGGKANWDFPPRPGEKKAPADAADMGLPHLTEVALKNVSLTCRDAASGRSWPLFLSDFTVNASEAGSALYWNIQGTYGEDHFGIKAKTGLLADLGRPGKDYPLNVSLGYDGFAGGFDGQLAGGLSEPRLNGKVRGQFTRPDPGSPNPRPHPLTRFLGLPPPPENASFSFTLEMEKEKIFQAKELHINMGKNNLSGHLIADFAKARPQIGGDLSSGYLDLRPFVKSGDEDKGREPARLFSPASLPVSALAEADLAFTVRAQALRVPDLFIRNLNGLLVQNKGTLRIRVQNASLFQGSLKADLDVKAMDRELAGALSVQAQDVDLAAMQEDLEAKDGLTGKADLSAKLDFTGGSPAEILARSNGKLVFTARDATVDNGKLRHWGESLGQSLLRLLHPGEKAQDRTDIRCAVLGLVIRDGRARTSALLLDLPDSLVLGDGGIDLSSEDIDVSIKSIPKHGLSAGDLGKLTVSLGELAEPFKLSGTLTHPSLGVDPEATAILVGKSLGGVALFGPAGVLTALVGADQEEKDPCRTAEAAARKGELAPGVDGYVDEAAGTLKEGVNHLEKGIGGLFR